MKLFSTKKIAHRITLGERLRMARLSLNINLEQAEYLSKIRLKYLEALENNDYSSLPSLTYIKCFIRTYARILNLPSNELLSQFRQEYEFEQTLPKNPILATSDLQKPTFILTPTKIASFIVGLIIMIFGSYVWYQVSGFTAAPEIKLTNPSSAKTEVAASSINLEGKTDPGSSLYLNQQILGTDTKGKFNIEIRLKEGVNLLELISKNKLGKETKKIVTIIAHLPDLEKNVLGIETNNGLNLTVEAGPDSTWLSIFSDNKRIFRGVMLAKTKQQFFAATNFSITTTNAGSLHLYLNGKDMGIAGAENQTRTIKLDKNDLTDK